MPDSLSDTDSVFQLALEERKGKTHAIHAYDTILWKIRAGYVAVLYGGLALLLGKDNPLDLSQLPNQPTLAAALFLLILGFSSAAFVIDLGYLRQKLRVIVARDHLSNVLLALPLSHEHLPELLSIAGEIPPTQLQPADRARYRQRLFANVWWTLVPLYGLPPAITAALIGLAFLIKAAA